jgi:hypothetical protein
MDEHDRARLRQLAEAATPGPWYYDGRDIFTTQTRVDSIASGHRLVIPLPETWHESQAVNKADATYIAAVSPDVVLALLDTQ